MRALSPATEEAELIDPAGLGGYDWLVQAVGLAAARPLPAGRCAGRSASAARRGLTPADVAGHGAWQHGRRQSTGSRRRPQAGAPCGTGSRRLGRRPTWLLNLGPQHPSTHGVLRLRLVLDGDRIIAAEPVIGYMHRGAEKLFEVRDYRQIIVLANRHDWLSAFANELGVVLAVERLLGMEVPPARRSGRAPCWPSSTGCSTTWCSSAPTRSELRRPITPGSS